MIKTYPISSQISERLPSVEAYLGRRKDVVFAYLFGSFATGKVHPLSDLDIAVYLDGLDISEKRLEILGHLAGIFKTDEIDLVVLNTAPLTLKMKILQFRRVMG
jgi:predicted nucleotidyltransferase